MLYAYNYVCTLTKFNFILFLNFFHCSQGPHSQGSCPIGHEGLDQGYACIWKGSNDRSKQCRKCWSMLYMYVLCCQSISDILSVGLQTCMWSCSCTCTPSGMVAGMCWEWRCCCHSVSLYCHRPTAPLLAYFLRSAKFIINWHSRGNQINNKKILHILNITNHDTASTYFSIG